MIEDTAMPEDAGTEMKARLRVDLRTAMKGRRTAEAQVIRALVAAIDNAEAPPIDAGETAPTRRDFQTASGAEFERLFLSRSDVQNVILAEIHESERAAAELERVARTDRAEALRAEILIARRYLA
jgi:uncharacterized protein YqeY